jgi:hypothetical protein
MVKIAFWDNSLCERGTTVTLYNYAYFNKKMLNNESIILYNTTCHANCDTVIEKFQREFQVFGVDNFNLVDEILLKNKCDIFYITKGGENEGQISKVCKTVVHCVFNCSQPHGDIYSSISNWLPGNDGKFPTVPYMVNLPNTEKNMRKELNIPENAIVYGRYGGYNEFDISYVHYVVYTVAIQKPNIYFIFLNTRPFCDTLPNIIHLDKIIDVEKKVEFINTCDAMLWARSMGESFGLAIAEFSTKNKPVIATKVNGDKAYIHMLGDKALWYENDHSLYNILMNFNKEEITKRDWNAYRDYEPEKVMSIFKSVFID